MFPQSDCSEGTVLNLPTQRIVSRAQPGLFGPLRLLAALCVLVLSTISAPAQETVTGVNPIPGFEHGEAAGFPLTGRHSQIICEACHINNELAGTPRTCVGCHNGERARGKFAGHPPAGNDCSQCHTTNNFVPFAIDHTNITQTCVTCHNGNRAFGKPADHIPAPDTCDDCHVTTNIRDARFDHSSITAACATCHDGGLAPGKPANHIVVGDDCSACHSVFAFGGAVFDHTSVDQQPCASCHNNFVTIGKPVDHVPAPEACELCHSPFFDQQFASANLDHTVVAGDCAMCHFVGNPWDAPSQPSNHIATNDTCDSCHSTLIFQIGQQVDHAAVVGACESCHFAGNTFGAPSQPAGHVGTSMDCAACHLSTASFSVVSMDHSEITAPCATCHLGSAFYADAPAKASAPPAHSGVSDDCAACHNTVSFASVAAFDHGGVVAACSTCHLVGSQLGSAPTKPTTGSHTGTTDTCDDCHNTVAFNPVASMDHGSVTAACSTCHLTGAQLGSAPLKPTTGPHTGTTNTCDDCHNTVAFNPVALMDHGSVTAACSTCHLTGAQLGSAPIKPTTGPHTGTTNTCDDCHNDHRLHPGDVDGPRLRHRNLFHLPPHRVTARRGPGQTHKRRPPEHDGQLHKLPQHRGIRPGRHDRPHRNHRHLQRLPRRRGHVRGTSAHDHAARLRDRLLRRLPPDHVVLLPDHLHGSHPADHRDLFELSWRSDQRLGRTGVDRRNAASMPMTGSHNTKERGEPLCR